MSHPTEAQGWQSYVRMAADMPDDLRALLTSALDAIWQVRDGEGRQLIMRAGATMPVELRLTTTENTGYSHGGYEQPHIQFNASDLARLCIADRDGAVRHASITGVLVHELFHATDKRGDGPLIRQGLYEGLELALGNGDLTEEAKDAILVDYVTFASYAPSLEQLYTRLGREGTPGNHDHTALIKQLRDSNFEHLANHLEKTPEFMQRWMQATGLFDASGTERTEADATRFTDAFMAKYFNGEPWRAVYSNSLVCDVAQPLYTPPLRAQPAASEGYISALGDALPRVLPSGLRYDGEATLPSIAPNVPRGETPTLTRTPQ